MARHLDTLPIATYNQPDRKGARPMTQCETCCFYNYDEEYDEYICDVDLDEDEMVRFLSGRGDCPYWRPGDEYRTARRQ